MIEEGRKVLFVNTPNNYKALLGHLSENVTVMTGPKGHVDIIQFLYPPKRNLEQLVKLKLFKSKRNLWLTYHKGTSKIKTDINRDIIYKYALCIGL